MACLDRSMSGVEQCGMEAAFVRSARVERERNAPGFVLFRLASGKGRVVTRMRWVLSTPPWSYDAVFSF